MNESRKRLFASFAVLAFTLCVFAGIAFADDDTEVDAIAVSTSATVNLGSYSLEVGDVETIDLDRAFTDAYENPRSNFGSGGSRIALRDSDYSNLPSWMTVSSSDGGSYKDTDLSMTASLKIQPTSVQSSQTYNFMLQYTLYYNASQQVHATFNCSITVEVVDSGTPVTSVSISGGTSGTVGGTITLTATTSPTGADDRHVTWSITSGSNYASISNTTNTTSGGTCKLSLNGAGSVTVRADAADGKGAYDTHTITITEQKITSLSISAGSGGSSITLTAKYSPSTANPNLTWEIYNGSSYGHLSSYSGDSVTVYPDSRGTIQIRVTDEISGRTATDTVYVFEMAFNANGGSGAPSSQIAIDDSTSYRISIPYEEPYRSGWEFMGWSTSASGSPSYEAGDTYSCSYSSTRTMYAIWGDYGYLEFDRNGGSGSVPSDQFLLIAEDDYDYIDIPNSPTPTMSGMEFVGWCEDDNGNGTIYDPGDSVSVDCGETVILYAIYEDPYETFTLNYNKNAGSDNVTNMPLAQTAESATGSASFTLRSNVPERSGYIFTGWKANNTGTTYQPGASYTANSTSVTMYAQWEAAVIEITSSQPSDLTYTVGEQFTYNVTANTDGCTVSVSGADWLIVSGMTVTGTPVTAGDYNVTLTVSKDGYTSDTISFTIKVYSSMAFTSVPGASGIYAYLED